MQNPGKNNYDVPLVTVVTVVFNGGTALEKTMESVLAQRYPAVEYIVIDGGSTDSTLSIIKKYEKRISYWVSEPDKGIYDAMNKAIKVAKGQWINFMNCGDTFASVDVLMMFKDSQFDADIVYGDAVVKYDGFTSPFPKNELAKIWRSTPFCHQAAFARTSLMKEYKFELKYQIGADHAFFYRAFKEGKKFFYVPRLICLFDGTQGSTKRRIFNAISDKEDLALRYDFSVGKWMYYKGLKLYVYIASAVKKIIGPKITTAILRRLKKTA